MSEKINEAEPELMAAVPLSPAAQAASGAAKILEKLRAALADEPKNIDCLAALAAAVVDIVEREKMQPRRHAAAETFHRLLAIVALDRFAKPPAIIQPRPPGIIIP